MDCLCKEKNEPFVKFVKERGALYLNRGVLVGLSDLVDLGVSVFLFIKKQDFLFLVFFTQ